MDQVFVRASDGMASIQKPDGGYTWVPLVHVQGLMNEGWMPESPKEHHARIAQEHYQGMGGKALGLALARGGTAGISDWLLTESGYTDAEEIAGLKQHHPGTSTLGEVGGIVTGGFVGGPVAALGRGATLAGRGATRGIAGLIGAGRTARVGGAMTRGAVDVGGYVGTQAFAESQIYPEMTVGEVLKRTATGAGLGAGFGVAGMALGAAFKWARGRTRKAAEKMGMGERGMKLQDDIADLEMDLAIARGEADTYKAMEAGKPGMEGLEATKTLVPEMPGIAARGRPGRQIHPLDAETRRRFMAGEPPLTIAEEKAIRASAGPAAPGQVGFPSTGPGPRADVIPVGPDWASAFRGLSPAEHRAAIAETALPGAAVPRGAPPGPLVSPARIPVQPAYAATELAPLKPWQKAPTAIDPIDIPMTGLTPLPRTPTMPGVQKVAGDVQRVEQMAAGRAPGMGPAPLRQPIRAQLSTPDEAVAAQLDAMAQQQHLVARQEAIAARPTVPGVVETPTVPGALMPEITGPLQLARTEAMTPLELGRLRYGLGGAPTLEQAIALPRGAYRRRRLPRGERAPRDPAKSRRKRWLEAKPTAEIPGEQMAEMGLERMVTGPIRPPVTGPLRPPMTGPMPLGPGVMPQLTRPMQPPMTGPIRPALTGPPAPAAALDPLATAAGKRGAGQAIEDVISAVPSKAAPMTRAEVVKLGVPKKLANAMPTAPTPALVDNVVALLKATRVRGVSKQMRYAAIAKQPGGEKLLDKMAKEGAEWGIRIKGGPVVSVPKNWRAAVARAQDKPGFAAKVDELSPSVAEPSLVSFPGAAQAADEPLGWAGARAGEVGTPTGVEAPQALRAAAAGEAGPIRAGVEWNKPLSEAERRRWMIEGPSFEEVAAKRNLYKAIPDEPIDVVLTGLDQAATRAGGLEAEAAAAIQRLEGQAGPRMVYDPEVAKAIRVNNAVPRRLQYDIAALDRRLNEKKLQLTAMRARLVENVVKRAVRLRMMRSIGPGAQDSRGGVGVGTAAAMGMGYMAGDVFGMFAGALAAPAVMAAVVKVANPLAKAGASASRAVARVNKTMGRAIKLETLDTMTPGEYKKLERQLMATDPQRLAAELELAMPQNTPPDVKEEVKEQILSGVTHLQAVVPKAPQGLPPRKTKNWRPNQMQLDSFVRSVAAVLDTARPLKELANLKLTREGIAALQATRPRELEALREGIRTVYAMAVARGEDFTAIQEMQLALFLGDDSIKPLMYHPIVAEGMQMLDQNQPKPPPPSGPAPSVSAQQMTNLDQAAEGR